MLEALHVVGDVAAIGAFLILFLLWRAEEREANRIVHGPRPGDRD